MTVEELLEEARVMALELRIKDKIIARLQARVAELEPPPDEPEPLTVPAGDEA